MMRRAALLLAFGGAFAACEAVPAINFVQDGSSDEGGDDGGDDGQAGDGGADAPFNSDATCPDTTPLTTICCPNGVACFGFCNQDTCAKCTCPTSEVCCVKNGSAQPQCRPIGQTCP